MEVYAPRFQMLRSFSKPEEASVHARRTAGAAADWKMRTRISKLACAAATGTVHGAAAALRVGMGAHPHATGGLVSSHPAAIPVAVESPGLAPGRQCRPARGVRIELPVPLSLSALSEWP
jgi:hypothetical protein